MDCLFCKIINGSIPSYTIYEDEYVKCFLDINPIECGHILVIPKKHFKDMYDINEKYLLEIYKSAKIVMELINNKLNPSGIKLTQNNGSLQDIKHFHLHIIPKYDKPKNLKVEEVFDLLTK